MIDLTTKLAWRSARQAATASPALVAFLPGLGTTTRIWQDVARALRTDVDVLLGDLPGHGRSAPRRVASIEGLARDVAEDLEVLGGRRPVVLIGLSVGGVIALDVASVAANNLIGFASFCSGAQLGDDAGWAALIARVRDEGPGSLTDDSAEGWFTSEYRSRHPAAVRRIQADLARVDRASYIGLCEALARYDGRARASRATCPALIVGGSLDTAVPPAAAFELSRALPAARYAELDAGHLAVVERPGDAAALIDELLSEAFHQLTRTEAST